MKQRITIQQLSKLSLEQKDRLREWWNPEPSDSFTNGNADVFYVGSLMRSPGKFITYGDDIPHDKEGLLPLLSIGQMIQFIQEKKPLLKSISKARFNKWSINIETATLGYKDELCDALWEATTQILKNP